MKLRKYIATFLAAAMVVTTIPLSSFDNAYAGMSASVGIVMDGTVVTGYGEGKDTVTRIVIPASVTEIKAGAFYTDDFPALKEIVIQGDSTVINEKAFGYDKAGNLNQSLEVWCNSTSKAETYAKSIGVTAKYLNTKDIEVNVDTKEYWSGCKPFKLSTKVSTGKDGEICDDIVWKVDETAYQKGLVWFQEGDTHVSETSGVKTYNSDGTTESEVSVYVIATEDMQDNETSFTISATSRGAAADFSHEIKLYKATSTITPVYSVYQIQQSFSNNTLKKQVTNVDPSTGSADYVVKKVTEGTLTKEEADIYIDQGYILAIGGILDSSYDHLDISAPGDSLREVEGTEENLNNLYNIDDEDGNLKLNTNIKPIISGMYDKDTGEKVLDSKRHLIIGTQSGSTPEITLISQNRVLTRKIDTHPQVPADKLKMKVGGVEYANGGGYKLIEKAEVSLEAILEPTGTTDEVEWISSNDKIASIAGKTLNVGDAGDVKITCKVKDVAKGLPTGKRYLQGSFNLVVIKKVAYQEIVFATDDTKTETTKDYYLATEKTMRPIVCDAREGKIYIAPENETAANEPLNYSSSDTSIATVDKEGNIKAGKKAGVTTISVTAPESGVKNSFTLHVYAPAQQINANTKSTVVCGQVTDIPYTFEPADASEDVIWTSQNTDIVTASDYIDGNGDRFIKVDAKKNGTTEIVGKTYSGVYKTMVIEVVEAVHADTVHAKTSDETVTESVDEDGTATFNVVKGKTIDLEAVLTSASGKNVNDTFKWLVDESSTIGDITATPAGVLSVKATTTGKARVTLVSEGYNVSDNGEKVKVTKEFTFYINVYSPAQSVAINFGNSTAAYQTIELGTTKQAYATINPTDCKEAITWTTDNDNLNLSLEKTLSGANYKLTIEAAKAGVTTLTATTDTGKTQSIQITVTKPFTSVNFIQNGKQIENNTIYVVKGQQTEVSLDVLEADTTDTEFTWSKPNDTGIITIEQSENGKKAVIMGSMQGTQNISVTAKSSNKSVSATVKVIVPATGIKLGNTSFSVYKNDGYFDLIADLEPTSCTDIVSWSMDKEGIVTLTPYTDAAHTTATKKTVKVVGIEAGTVTITATTVSGMTATATVTVEAKKMEETEVTALADKMYNGQAQEFTSFSIKYTDGKSLVKGTDYDVTYENNVNVGTATVTFTGKGNFAGEKKVNFNIKPKQISSVNVPIATTTYCGSAIVPEVVAEDGQISVDGKAKVLVEGTDYTLVYENNLNAGQAKVTLKGKGNYTGEKSISFRIEQKDISVSPSITVYVTKTMTYTGAPLQPTVIVKDGTKILVKDTDYTVSISNNTNAGVGVVRITGKGNYKGTKEAKFTIVRRSIAGAKVAKIDNKIANGSAFTPSVTVTLGTRTLSSSNDYVLTYAKNKYPGKATVKITGKGNYSGAIYTSFIILPKRVENVKMSSNKTSSVTLKWDKITGATGYIVYKVSGSKLTKVATSTKNTVTVSKLKSGTDYQYQVAAYVKVGTKQYIGDKSYTVTAGTKTSTPKIKKIKGDTSRVDITIGSVKGASKYVVYYATKKSGKYKEATSTSSTTCSVTGLKAKRTYYFKVKAVRNISGKEYSSSYSSIKSARAK